MNQLKRLFDSLTLKQRIWIAVAALAVSVVIYGAVHWTAERDFKPLYTDLAPEDGGAVLAKVRETGTPYRLAGNGTRDVDVGQLGPEGQVGFGDGA